MGQPLFIMFIGQMFLLSLIGHLLAGREMPNWLVFLLGSFGWWLFYYGYYGL